MSPSRINPKANDFKGPEPLDWYPDRNGSSAIADPYDLKVRKAEDGWTWSITDHDTRERTPAERSFLTEADAKAAAETALMELAPQKPSETKPPKPSPIRREPSVPSPAAEAHAPEPPPPDHIAVLTSEGENLTKVWFRGKNSKAVNKPYDQAKIFDAQMVPVTKLTELARVLDGLHVDQAVIHGALKPELGDQAKGIRRLLYAHGEDAPATLTEAAHHWVLLDVDGIPCPDGLNPVTEPERASAHVICLLPEEFHGAAHWWQLTGSAGFKPGIRMRLAFWMDRALTSRDVKVWLSKVKGLDLSIYTPNQLVYAASPRFNGVPNPLSKRPRSGLCEGKVVSPPELRPALDSTQPDEPWGQPQRALRKYPEWRAAIGDHAEGQGFFEPIKSAIGSWIQANPGEDTAWLRADLEKAISKAKRDPALHDDAYIEQRVRDLDRAIAAIAARERAKPPPEWVEELNKRYAVARFGNKVVIAVTDESEISFVSKDAFFDMMANKLLPSTDEDEGTRKSKGRAWFRHFRRREYLSPGVVFEPSTTPLERPGALNLWRGFSVEPKKGDWSLMQAHIRNILANGNAEYAEYILNWMAYCLQHPELPAEVALAFTGLPGSGKGVVWSCFGSLFSPHFRHFSHPDQFTGKFNANLGKSVFVFLDEAIWGGDRTVEGKIKAMITERTLQIEPKGIDSLEVPNRLSIVACSNEAWSVPIGLGDRRWAAFRTSDRYAYSQCEEAEGRAYFGALHAQMEGGGRAAMLFDLLRRKVSANDIRSVPNTAEKARLKSLSLRPTQQWLEQLLQEGEIPSYTGLAAEPWDAEGLITDKEQLYDNYIAFCKENNKRPEMKSVWGRELRAILKDALDPECRTGSCKDRGPRKFRFEPLSRCRKQFDRCVGNALDGKHWDAAPSAAREKREPHLKVVSSGAPEVTRLQGRRLPRDAHKPS